MVYRCPSESNDMSRAMMEKLCTFIPNCLLFMKAPWIFTTPGHEMIRPGGGFVVDPPKSWQMGRRVRSNIQAVQNYMVNFVNKPSENAKLNNNKV